MVKFTTTNNPAVRKHMQRTNQPFISLSHDFKAEQFIRINALPYIISTRLYTDSTEKLSYFSKLQTFSKNKYKGIESTLEYTVIESFMSDFQAFYDNHCNTVIEGVSKKVTVPLLNDFLETRRADNSKYIPNIFSTKAKKFNRKNDLLTYGTRELLAEYLNILYFQEYQNLYTIEFSEIYGYYILTNTSIRLKILPGLTARISKPSELSDERSII
jgi:hypothetical protein